MPRIDTTLVHAGEPRPRIAGAVSIPVFQSSTFVYGGESSYHDVRYIRLSNTPNHVALHAKLAALEGGETALVTASGMAAISTTLLALLAPGDHLLVQDCTYGGTHDFIAHDLARLGISHTAVDPAAPATWERALRPTTRAFYVETISNPLMRVPDLAAVVAFARAHGLRSLIDNTLATPVNFRPLEHGFDLVLHSATKYLNGHSDIVAGAVVGGAALVETVKHTADHLGGSLDPHACFLLHRGMKTLALRVRHQNASALALARFLAGHPSVARVYYPGIETGRIPPERTRDGLQDPEIETGQIPPERTRDGLQEHGDRVGGGFVLEDRPKAVRPPGPGFALLAGGGGALSFELHGGVAAAERLLARVTLPACAPSLGGTETLITRPATTSHAGLGESERRRLGIAEGLIRLSVGIEAPEDLIDDLAQALRD